MNFGHAFKSFGENKYGKVIDPEERFLRLDGAPYHSSAWESLFYKNPQFLVGSAISFVGVVIGTAYHPSSPLLYFTSNAIATIVMNQQLPYYVEQANFRSHPELDGCSIDRYGEHPNKQDAFNAAISCYKVRFWRTLLIAPPLVAACSYLLHYDNLSQMASTAVEASGPPVSMILWAWWAKKNLQEREWTIAPHDPRASSCRTNRIKQLKRHLGFLPV